MQVFTITLTSKGQFTAPAPLRRTLGLTKGTKVDIFPLDRERFAARMHRPSRILDFAGDLTHWDTYPAYNDEEVDRA